MPNALRTLAALRAALDADGLSRDSSFGGGKMTGWLDPNRMGSTGFSIRGLPDGRIEWHIVISGKKHLRYREWDQEEIPYDKGDPDTVTLHEPTDTEVLHGRIAKAFASIGVPVTDVKATDWQNMWDDDVGYVARSEKPEWLDGPDPGNSWTWPSSPILVSLRPGSSPSLPSLRGNLVGYYIGAELYLTRESLELVAAAPPGTPPARGYGLGYMQRLPRTSGLDASAQLAGGPDRKAMNHWGDEVELWRTTRNLFDVDARFEPAVAFVMGGEVRTHAPFHEIGAQFGDDVPWSGEPAPGPRLP